VWVAGAGTRIWSGRRETPIVIAVKTTSDDLGGHLKAGHRETVDSRAKRDSVIGAGSVVLKGVGADQTVFGAPAKPVRLPTPER
jgi:hypothetical protein